MHPSGHDGGGPASRTGHTSPPTADGLEAGCVAPDFRQGILHSLFGVFAIVGDAEGDGMGFCHVVTSTARHKFAYIHHAKDAKGVFTMVFGPAWRDDDAMRIFVSRLEELKLPNVKVDHSKLLFLPQIKL